MRKTGKILLTLFVILICHPINAQKTLNDSFYIQFNKDKRALESFRTIGFLSVIENIVGNNDISFQAYAKLFNSFDPMTRLFDYGKLKAFFQHLNRSLSLIDDKNNNIGLLTKRAYKFYYYRRHIKREYQKFIFNSSNFRNDIDSIELEGMKRMYLESYYIKP